MGCCNENNIIYVRDLLEWYNNLDNRSDAKSVFKGKRILLQI